MSVLAGSVPWYLKLLFSQNVGILVDVFFFFQFDKSKGEYYTGNPKTTIYKWMCGETTIFYIKIRNHPTETSILKWMFQVPGTYMI